MASIYVASRFQHQPEACKLRDVLVFSGFTVTSTWLEQAPSLDVTATDEERATLAQADLWDVRRSDVFVLLNPPGSEKIGTGGCHVETGFALALQKRVIVLGPRSNIFHHLIGVEAVDSVEELVRRLRETY